MYQQSCKCTALGGWKFFLTSPCSCCPCSKLRRLRSTCPKCSPLARRFYEGRIGAPASWSFSWSSRRPRSCRRRCRSGPARRSSRCSWVAWWCRRSWGWSYNGHPQILTHLSGPTSLPSLRHKQRTLGQNVGVNLSVAHEGDDFTLGNQQHLLQGRSGGKLKFFSNNK